MWNWCHHRRANRHNFTKPQNMQVLCFVRVGKRDTLTIFVTLKIRPLRQVTVKITYLISSLKRGK